MKLCRDPKHDELELKIIFGGDSISQLIVDDAVHAANDGREYNDRKE